MKYKSRKRKWQMYIQNQFLGWTAALAVASRNRGIRRGKRETCDYSQRVPFKGRNTRGPWTACQSSSRFRRGCRSVRSISPFFRPTPLADPGNHVHAGRCGLWTPGSGEAHRSTACESADAPPGACVPHRAPFIPMRSRRGTPPDDLPREERERDSSRRTPPLINTRRPPRRPRTPSRILSGPRARISGASNNIFRDRQKKEELPASSRREGANCVRAASTEEPDKRPRCCGPLCNPSCADGSIFKWVDSMKLCKRSQPHEMSFLPFVSRKYDENSALLRCARG